MAFGVALFAVGPEPTSAQIVFRLLVILVGLAGLGLLRTRKR